jgi:hypothetical protein
MLDEWKEARNSCVEDIIKMRKEICEVFGNIMNQKPELKERFDKFNKYSDVLEHCIDGILVHIWLNDVMGNESKVTAVKGQSLTRQGTAWIIFHDKAPIQTQLIFNGEDRHENVDLAKEIVQASIWTIKNLRLGKEGLIDNVRQEMHKMQESASRLEAALNPLVLRPIVLNTRCDICPI